MKASYFDLTALGWKGKILDAISKILNNLNSLPEAEETFPSGISSKLKALKKWARMTLAGAAALGALGAAQAGSWTETSSYDNEGRATSVGYCDVDTSLEYLAYQVGPGSSRWYAESSHNSSEGSQAAAISEACPDAPVASTASVPDSDFNNLEGFKRRIPTAEEIASCEGARNDWIAIGCNASIGNTAGVRSRAPKFNFDSLHSALESGVANCYPDIIQLAVDSIRAKDLAKLVVEHKDWPRIQRTVKRKCPQMTSFVLDIAQGY